MPMISGRVFNAFTGEGIPATVRIGGAMTTANGSGNFSMFVNPGSYSVTAHHVGYSSGSVFVVVQSYDVSISIPMSPLFQAL